MPLIKWLAKKYVENATFRKMIKKIVEIDNNDTLWKEMLKQPWYNDNKPSIYLDKERIRRRLKEIVETGKDVKNHII